MVIPAVVAWRRRSCGVRTRTGPGARAGWLVPGRLVMAWQASAMVVWCAPGRAAMRVLGMPGRWWQMVASSWVSRGYLKGAAGPVRARRE